MCQTGATCRNVSASLFSFQSSASDKYTSTTFHFEATRTVRLCGFRDMKVNGHTPDKLPVVQLLTALGKTFSSLVDTSLGLLVRVGLRTDVLRFQWYPPPLLHDSPHPRKRKTHIAQNNCFPRTKCLRWSCGLRFEVRPELPTPNSLWVSSFCFECLHGKK